MQERQTNNLSVVQVLAGALAAASAALVTSVFGVAGTILGAAITSVVITVGSALYTHSMERARARVRLRRDPETGETEREVEAAPVPRRSIPWVAVASGAALMFVLAIAVLTGVEALAGRPATELVSRPVEGGERTTVGTVLREVPDRAPGPERRDRRPSVAEREEPIPDSPARREERATEGPAEQGQPTPGAKPASGEPTPDCSEDREEPTPHRPAGGEQPAPTKPAERGDTGGDSTGGE